LTWLRVEHPNAIIKTTLISHTTTPPMAVFRAKVSIPGGGSATGWGQEEAADFGDYLEKAETKALGRALAALGFGTQFTDDFDFGDDAQGDNRRVVDSPVQRAPRSGVPVQRTVSIVTPPVPANQDYFTSLGELMAENDAQPEGPRTPGPKAADLVPGAIKTGQKDRFGNPEYRIADVEFYLGYAQADTERKRPLLTLKGGCTAHKNEKGYPANVYAIPGPVMEFAHGKGPEKHILLTIDTGTGDVTEA
jgi:hypothetical protein